MKTLLKDYHHRAKQNKINIVKELILLPHYAYCKRILHCKAEEYFAYRFYQIGMEERKKFLLSYHQKSWYARINKKQVDYTKNAMAERFTCLYNREVLYLSQCDFEAFEAFFKRHGKIILKPDKASLGRGIQAAEYSDPTQAAELYSSFVDKDYVCEEFIRQHPEMSRLNPHAVNTVRILALRQSNEVKIIAAALRTGKADSVVDNLKHGGIGANVNVETGIVDTHGMDYARNTYLSHPDTGCPFLGFQIPFWKEALAMITDAHMQAFECALLGWDVAITETGPALVEANNRPGPMIHQYIDRVPRCEEVVRLLKEKAQKQ